VLNRSTPSGESIDWPPLGRSVRDFRDSGSAITPYAAARCGPPTRPHLTSSRHQLRSPRSPCPRHLGPRLCASDEWPRRLFDGVLNRSTPTKEPGDQSARRGLQRTIIRATDRRSLRQRLLAVDRQSAPIQGRQGTERGRRSPTLGVSGDDHAPATHTFDDVSVRC
jgi:hypothetical protein